MTASLPHRPVALLGIGGGVAAYKAVTVASRLRQAQWQVHVAMTQGATQFVTPLTFAAVTGRRAVTDLFQPQSDAREDLFPHLFPATEADVFCVLPATANLIAKLAHGIGDDPLTTAALSLPATCRRYICPAMNVEMWAQPVVQQNVAILDALGWTRLGPDAGHQACGAVGPGRMWEPDAILDRLLADQSHSDALAGRRVLILSGPTVEAIDPVRFITNRSTGIMGKAIAEAAAAAGAQVEFVSGPVPAGNLPRHPAVTVTPIISAADMLAAATARFPDCHAAIFVAAVADYTPAHPETRKMTKKGENIAVELVPTTDIAYTLGAAKRPGQVCLGFALETHNGIAHAQTKLTRKNFDAIVLNGVDSFGAATGDFTLITAHAPPDAWGRLGKADCARRLVDHIAAQLPAKA